ncbi:putative aldouronate transport system substrate-binding protein [Paenibacillus taihuensis]|uniref:Putative aldouronate transport system substrate-binding protein n=1 Tax=Paenibacillus taihuensis TaxID=1156355 RepID=A0A3D9SD35_9BACL|nr:ABC transporter substrate-binding protein [Paenibacillus taihuensis]REE92772.1 putative aldouronate transport system substrate-binding protein [Paenibacillus taihuensis]
MQKRFQTSMLALSIILVLSLLLSACGGSSNKDNAASGSNAAASNNAAGSANSGNEKTLELKVAFLGIGTFKDVADVQDAISKITKEKLNATVKLVPIDPAAWQQQINLQLAGNEPLDLLVTSSAFNYSTQAAKNQLVVLDDLLEKYGQGIKDTMPEAIFNGTKINGKIYGVPSVRDTAADYGFIARKDLLDKYSIDLSTVKSYADLEPILKTIKDSEPGVSPIVQRSSTLGIATEMITSQFDVLGDSLGVLNLNNNDTKVVNLFDTQEYKDSLALTRKWYQAGYIMKDAATTQEGNNALIKAGKGFGYFSNMKPGFEAQESGIDGHEMAAVRLTKPVSGSASANIFMISIPRNTQDENRAMQLMNLMYTNADIVNLLDNGVEGKHYVAGANGQIRSVGADSGWVFNQWEVGNNALAKVWEGTAPDVWEQMKKFNESSIVSPALGFSFDSSAVKTEIAAATNVINQYRAGLDSGSIDPAMVADFNDKLKAAGLDKIIAEKQKQLDAFIAAGAGK